MTKQQEHTPLIQQYYEIKTSYPDALLLFQVGDFYELFFDDAKQAAACLGIALTSRGKTKGEPIPLCGVPIHALDHYLRKLVKNGFKVAICDQLEEARPGALVKRGVKQVLTPGTLTDAQLLDDKSASYLFSFYPAGESWGLVFSELLTAQLFITTIPSDSLKLLESELIRFFPDEVLIPDGKNAKEFQAHFKRMGYFTTVVHLDDNRSDDTDVLHWTKRQFSSSLCEKIHSNEAIKQALHYFYAYMSKNQRESLSQFHSISFYQSDDFLLLDGATERNLEIVKNAQDGSRKNTLFDVMDRAYTAMGSRMIKKWLLRPLVKKEAIVQRQDVVRLFLHDIQLSYEIERLLLKVGDFERVVGRIALQRASVADYISLAHIVSLIPSFYRVLFAHKAIVLMKIIIENLGEFNELSDLLSRCLHDGSLDDDKIIKDGYDEKLDRMRLLVQNGAHAIAELENVEQGQTGIASLKIRYNNVQGYYIEVTNTHRDSIPERYKRIQTLVGRERFITPELQQLQYSIENARKDINVYERELFDALKSRVALHITALRKSAHAIAHIDALLCFARLAHDYEYVCPEFNSTRDIIIQNGRHPVVERSLMSGFIPNDTYLTDEQSLWIITGPNMGGKSTYLRQVALICIMAHSGSFVPARSAQLSLLDRIFTRLGASDNVSEGKSTFLVEMEETSTICTQATERSLVILDEVGRGTSTVDGLAIAQAVVEHLFDTVKSRCLFATHYHELVNLQKTRTGIVAYHAASKETEKGIVFLYKMVRGVANGSFGIEVAKIARLPYGIINRAAYLAEMFAAAELCQIGEKVSMSQGGEGNQGRLLRENDALRCKNDELVQRQRHFERFVASIDFDELSPKKAFDLLWQLKDL